MPWQCAVVRLPWAKIVPRNTDACIPFVGVGLALQRKPVALGSPETRGRKPSRGDEDLTVRCRGRRPGATKRQAHRRGPDEALTVR